MRLTCQGFSVTATASGWFGFGSSGTHWVSRKDVGSGEEGSLKNDDVQRTGPVGSSGTQGFPTLSGSQLQARIQYKNLLTR